jgi:quinol monooxygenase YgiN
MHHYSLQTRFVSQETENNNLLQVLTRIYNKIAYAHGCHLYLINQDTENNNHILVTELWDSAESHAISQTMDGCKELMSQVTPLLAAEPERKVLRPVAGKGLV